MNKEKKTRAGNVNVTDVGLWMAFNQDMIDEGHRRGGQIPNAQEMLSIYRAHYRSKRPARPGLVTIEVTEETAEWFESPG